MIGLRVASLVRFGIQSVLCISSYITTYSTRRNTGTVRSTLKQTSDVGSAPNEALATKMLDT